MRNRSSRPVGRLGLAGLAMVTAASGLMTLAATTATTTAAGASSEAPITIAMITSLTGPGSSEFSNAPAGFNARIAQQNAEGGVNGHKLVGLVLDDQTARRRS